MIRDLRNHPPRLAPPDSRSLAFSRDLVSRTGFRAPADRTQTGHAFTIAVTAPRMLTCKRGLAAHLAAHLATMVAADGSSVCVVDADIESRDIGKRFDVDGPLLLDVAKAAAFHDQRPLDSVITRVYPSGLYVLPTRPPQAALLPLLRSKTSGLLGALNSVFDFIVIDAPVSLGIDAIEIDPTILRHTDVLLVAVTADASAFGGAVRYLNAIASAIRKGALPPTFDVRLVLTGNDHDGSRTMLDLQDIERKFDGLPIIGSVPQLWGRNRPDTHIERSLDPALRATLTQVVDELTRVVPPPRV